MLDSSVEMRRLLAFLTPEERAELDSIIQAPSKWAPLPGPQDDAYHCTADILLYGGAAGGGKTDLLLGVAKTEHHRSIIFRRVFPSLRGIIDRSREIYNAGASSALRDSYNESLHRWRFSDGRSVRFASLQFEKDVTDYQGQAHDLYGFDEITEFTESQFRFVTGWNRTTRNGQRCRIICTGNPPTNADGEWVIRYWAPWLDESHPKPALPGELRYFTTIAGKDVELPNGDPVQVEGMWVYPRSRTFIPAKVQDNPYLVRSGYVSTLQALPEPLRSKLLFGDFRAGREDDAYQVIPTAWVRAAQDRWRERTQPPGPPEAIGCDVARGGKDRTSLAPRWGNYFGQVMMHPGKSTPDGPAVAALCIQARGPDTTIKIDILGVGTSPFDHLRTAIKGKAIAMNGGAGSNAKDKSKQLGFANKRAEWYWKLREALDPTSGHDIALPPDPELRSDLCAPTWKLITKGILIEPKDDIIARIGRSPDKGDAVVYAHATEGTDDLDFLRTMAER